MVVTQSVWSTILGELTGGSGQVPRSGPGPEGFNTAQVTAQERRALMAGEEAGWKPGSQ